MASVRSLAWSIWLIWFVLFIWFVSFNQTNETDQTNQITVFLRWQDFFSILLRLMLDWLTQNDPAFIFHRRRRQENAKKCREQVPFSKCPEMRTE
jgi:hypothetical protein